MRFARDILFSFNAALPNAFTIIKPAKMVAGDENVCIVNVHEVVSILPNAQNRLIIIKKKRKDLPLSNCIISKLQCPMHPMIPKVH